MDRQHDTLITVQAPAGGRVQIQGRSVVERDPGDQRTRRHEMAVQRGRDATSASRRRGSDEDDPPGRSRSSPVVLGRPVGEGDGSRSRRGRISRATPRIDSWRPTPHPRARDFAGDTPVAKREPPPVPGGRRHHHADHLPAIDRNPSLDSFSNGVVDQPGAQLCRLDPEQRHVQCAEQRAGALCVRRIDGDDFHAPSLSCDPSMPTPPCASARPVRSGLRSRAASGPARRRRGALA